MAAASDAPGMVGGGGRRAGGCPALWVPAVWWVPLGGREGDLGTARYPGAKRGSHPGWNPSIPSEEFYCQ